MSIANAFQALIATPEPPDLGPGPRAGVLPQKELTRQLERHFQAARFSAERRDLIRALVLLWHDHLDEAHSIAQRIENADGAFVHGILHRREPDYGNAAYWFRRVGAHPAFPEIARRAAASLEAESQPELLGALTPGGRWDALAFIRACGETASLPAAARQKSLLRELQRAESEALLGWFAITNSQ